MSNALAGNHGLRNIGNRCYANALLQCLCGVFFSEGSHPEHFQANDFSRELFGLLRNLRSAGTNSLDPDPFLVRSRSSAAR